VYLQLKYLAPGTQTPSDSGIFHGAYTNSSLPFTVTQPTYPPIHIVVPRLNVPIRMTDIFASFANNHLKHFPQKKKLFLPLPPRKLWHTFSFNLK